mgnify:CR=1 FL=1
MSKSRARGYRYLKGLAELAREFKDPRLYIVDTKTFPGGYCEYCGALLRYYFVVESDGRELRLGCECASKFFKYLNLPEDYAERALRFFQTYIKLKEASGKRSQTVDEYFRKVSRFLKVTNWTLSRESILAYIDNISKLKKKRKHATIAMDFLRFIASQKGYNVEPYIQLLDRV